MNTITILENSISLDISESWMKTCYVMNDRPFSAAFWNLEQMSGEDLLNELPDLQVALAYLKSTRN